MPRSSPPRTSFATMAIPSAHVFFIISEILGCADHLVLFTPREPSSTCVKRNNAHTHMDTSAMKNSFYSTCCGVEVSCEGRSRPTVRGHTPPEATGGASRILSRPPGRAVGLPEDAVHEHPLHLLPGPAIAIVHRAIPQLERVEPD